MNNLFNSYSFLQVTFIVIAQYFEKFWLKDCFTISKSIEKLLQMKMMGIFVATSAL